MATSRKKTLPAASAPALRDKKAREALSLKLDRSDPNMYRKIAAQVTNTAVGAASSMQQIDSGEWLDVDALVDVLREQAMTVSAGDMSQPEAMLLGQAQTLEALFYRFTRSGMAQNALPQFEAHFRLALKAQSQSRMALEALAEMKNPRAIAFVKQANIATGHQQVNNGVPPQPVARAEEGEAIENKLLEANHGERMDTRAQSAASPKNPRMATVAAVNRTTKRGRKSASQSKR